MIEVDFRTFVLAIPGVRELVTYGSEEPRMYPMVVPQASRLPCLRYQLVSDVPSYHMEGASRLTTARLQVDVLGATYSAVATLARLLAAGLSGYRGPLGDSIAHAVFVENARDSFEPETRSHARSIDVRLVYGPRL